ncbi:hypothetical protein FOZ62_010431, partial [Perkinsus olseni]
CNVSWAAVTTRSENSSTAQTKTGVGTPISPLVGSGVALAFEFSHVPGQAVTHKPSLAAERFGRCSPQIGKRMILQSSLLPDEEPPEGKGLSTLYRTYRDSLLDDADDDRLLAPEELLPLLVRLRPLVSIGISDTFGRAEDLIRDFTYFI